MRSSLAQKQCFVTADVCYAPPWTYNARVCHVAGEFCVTKAWWSGGSRQDAGHVYTCDAERHPPYCGVAVDGVTLSHKEDAHGRGHLSP
jgi:hypothetical protein